LIFLKKVMIITTTRRRIVEENVQLSAEKYVTLLPRGQGFSNEPGSQEEACEAGSNQINQAKTAFKKSAKLRGAQLEGRKTRDEKPFISKFCFILQHQHFTCFSDSRDVILSLLSDTSTLFSRGYQAYQINRELFREMRLAIGKTVEDEMRYCRNKALGCWIANDEQRERYDFLLQKIEERVRGEWKNKKRRWSLAVFEEELLQQMVDRRDIKNELKSGRKHLSFRRVFDPAVCDYLLERFHTVLSDWILYFAICNRNPNMFLFMHKQEHVRVPFN